jgi:hypothetical protein
MHRRTLAIMLAAVLPGCAEEVIAVHDSSFSAKLAQFNRGGWEVASNSPPSQRRSSANEANVRVVGGIDWGQTQFNTNFQVDDPKLRTELEQRRQQRQQDQQNQGNQQNPQGRPPVPTTQPATAPSADPSGPSLFAPLMPGL